MTPKQKAAIETLETKIDWDFRNRRSMEPEYAREPKAKLENRRFAGRIERQELRALCVSLRALRVVAGA